jgi:hypothetical protein
MNACMNTYTYIDTSMYAYLHTYICICHVYREMYINKLIYTYQFIQYIYKGSVYIYIQIFHKYTYIKTLIYTTFYRLIDTYVHPHSDIRVWVYIKIDLYICIYTHVHSFIFLYVH